MYLGQDPKEERENQTCIGGQKAILRDLAVVGDKNSLWCTKIIQPDGNVAYSLW